MKKLKLTLAIIALTATASFAQTTNLGERRDSVFTNIMKLTPENKTKFMAIISESGKGQKAINTDASLNDDQKKQKLAAYRKEMSEREKTILTLEQLAQWKEFVKNESGRKKD